MARQKGPFGYAICDHCEREMLPGGGCNRIDVITKSGVMGSMIHIDENLKNCHDCGAGVGAYHHPGCDWERCPRCGRQLITCGCLAVNKEIDNMKTIITRAWAYTRPDGETEVRVNVDAASGTYVLKTEKDPGWAATFASKLGGRKTEYLRLVRV